MSVGVNSPEFNKVFVFVRQVLLPRKKSEWLVNPFVDGLLRKESERNCFSFLSSRV